MAKAIVVKNKILTKFEAHFSAYHPCLKIETIDQDHCYVKFEICGDDYWAIKQLI